MSHNSEISKRNKAFDKKYEEERYCRGCGCNFPLSRAHIIAVSKRKDLELDINNMRYLCMDYLGKKGCHSIWDSGTNEERHKLKCFDEFIEYIISKDGEHWHYNITEGSHRFFLGKKEIKLIK
jgi:hypothetical protein